MQKNMRARYTAIDAYTLEELRRKYQASDTRGRIRLLRSLYHRGDEWSEAGVPFEIAEMAVTDPSPEVRQWMARHGKDLNYSELGERFEVRFPERDLSGRLLDDPDPFIRACAYENPRIPPKHESFARASHLERLAQMRNPQIYGSDLFKEDFPNFPGPYFESELLEKILDCENTELGLTMKEREELLWAFLSNPSARTLLSNPKPVPPRADRTDPPLRDFYSFTKTRRMLWMLIEKWPAADDPWSLGDGPTALRRCIFLTVKADDETKAEGISIAR